MIRKFSFHLIILFAPVFLQNCLGNIVSFQGLGNLGGHRNYSKAYDVSGDGSIVVGVSLSEEYEAFIWTKATGMTGLNDTFITYSISNDGSTIVGSDRRGVHWAGYTWTEQNGVTKLASPAQSEDVHAIGCNYDGSKIVGNFQDSSTNDYYPPNMACLWENGLPMRICDGRATNITANGETIIGFTQDSEYNYIAFSWTKNGGQTLLPNLPIPNSQGIPVDISADGKTIVGWSGLETRKQACMWVDNDIIPLGSLALPGHSDVSGATDISADGSVIVGYSNVLYSNEAFIWDSNNRMRNLRDVLIDSYGLNLDNWILREAIAISDDGMTIVGNGSHNGISEAWIVTIPEPTTFLMLGFGTVIFSKKKRYNFR